MFQVYVDQRQDRDRTMMSEVHQRVALLNVVLLRRERICIGGLKPFHLTRTPHIRFPLCAGATVNHKEETQSPQRSFLNYIRISQLSTFPFSTSL